MRGVIAAVALLAGCDALWRIDHINLATPDGPTPDAPAIDARPHTGPFLRFTMDEVDSLETIDSIGNYDAVCEPNCPVMVDGHLAGALEFNSTGLGDQRLQIAAVVDGLEVVDQFSVVGWIQLNTLATEACPWSKPYSTGSADSWQLCINPSGAVSFITYSIGGPNELSTPPGWLILDAMFHHAAIVFDGMTKTIYWDGASAATGDGAVPLVDDDDVVLANDRDGTFYMAPLAGALDEVEFYTYALTPVEVAALAAQ